MSLQYVITNDMDKAFDKMLIRSDCSSQYLGMLLRSHLRAQECISAQLEEILTALQSTKEVKRRASFPP